MLKSAVSNQTTSVEDPGSRIGAYPDVEGGLGGGQVSVAPPTQAGERPLTRMSRVTRQEWAPSVLIFVADILIWTALYGWPVICVTMTRLSSGHFNLRFLRSFSLR